MGYDIFVSYSSQDKLFADAIVNSLENRNLRCWYAPRDIPPGVAWPSAIAGAIKQVPVMLLIFSASANSSHEVSRELTLASTNKRVVIPVRIENVLPSQELEYHLTNRHWLDVYDLELEPAVRQVLEVVDSYAHLFQRGEDGAVSSQPGAHPADGRLAQDLARRRRFKKLLPALLLVLALAAGSFFYLGGGAGESAKAPVAAKDAPVYVYGGANGLGLKTLRLKTSSPDAPQEFLLALSGLEGSPYNNAILLCRLDIRGGAYNFYIDVDGSRHTLFNVQEGVGTFFEPGSAQGHRLVYIAQDNGWEPVQKMLQAYNKQAK